MKVWQATQIADRSRNGESIPSELLAEATQVLTDAYREVLEENSASTPPLVSLPDAPEMKGRWVNGYFIAGSYENPKLVELNLPNGLFYIPK